MVVNYASASRRHQIGAVRERKPRTALNLSPNLQLQLISHLVGTDLIHQRAVDGFVNATAMCKADGKQFADYARLGITRAFLSELSSDMGIPMSGLVVTIRGGPPEAQGTWVHPDVAINLGQWCSPKFAVAVAKWVRDWFTGKIAPKTFPYHIRRYLANRNAIPVLHFSILNEMVFALIAPLEEAGYTLPDHLLPDISLGKMFCKWLRDEKRIVTDDLPTYRHEFEDGRVVFPKAYPIAVLADLRTHFHTTWLPFKAEKYFQERDPKALQYLPKLLPPPDPEEQKRDLNKSKFHQLKETIQKLSSPQRLTLEGR